MSSDSPECGKHDATVKRDRGRHAEVADDHALSDRAVRRALDLLDRGFSLGGRIAATREESHER